MEEQHICPECGADITAYVTKVITSDDPAIPMPPKDKPVPIEPGGVIPDGDPELN